MGKIYDDWKKNGGFLSYEEWLIDHGYMKLERWVPAYEFEGDYEVSSVGRVRNVWTGKVLKLTTNAKGYKTVSLSIGGKSYTRRVNRLVAESFTEGDHTGLDVNHIDGDKANNRLDNLEFCTRKENVEHALEHGLMVPNDFGKKRIKVRCVETGKVYDSIRACGRDINVDPSEVSRRLLRNAQCEYKGYHFEKIS